jgi:aryl-alcohol dehydrogenase-like predicted oxidoreductase
MQYSYLGESGLVVSKLAFGAMTFASEGAPPFARLGRAEAQSVIDQALENGVNMFDTANVYSGGKSETILGEILGERRKQAVIVTKAGARTGASPNDVGLSARNLHLNIDASLRRLNTDWIDVYLCHLPDTRTPLEETLLALDQIVRAGKVRYIGFSNWPAWLSSKAIAVQKANGWARFVTGQIKYSLIDRDVESDIVPAALDAGVGLMCYSPLSSGVLSGKYSDKDPTGGGGRLSQIKLITDVNQEMARAAVAALIEIAPRYDAPPAAIALAWLMQQPAVSTLLMGINSSRQLEENLAAARLQLSAEDLARLSQISQPKPRYPTSMLRGLGDGWCDPRDRQMAPAPSTRGAWAPSAKQS